MTAEASPTAPSPRPPQCPRCGTLIPLTPAGTQIIRCAGCGAALQVSVRPVEPPRPAEPPATGDDMGARPRRRPMVEVSGPRRAEVRPVATFTVELSQSDIDTEGLEAAAPPRAAVPPTIPPVAPPPPPTSLDTPWFAEDIERLPEANASLGQLALESFESLPPLPQRPDVSAPRTPAPRPPSSRDK